MHSAGGDSGSGVDRKDQSQIRVRPARPADLCNFYGKLPWTMRALVAEVDGKVEGVVGVKRDRDHGLYFSDFTDALKPYLDSLIILRAIKASMMFVEEYKGPVFAIATDAEACRLLHRLGFTHLDGEWYGWLH